MFVLLFFLNVCACDSMMPADEKSVVNHVQRLEKIDLVFPGGTFPVELADEPHEMALGFRFRAKIQERDAMLFVLRNNTIQSLSMKDVLFPLSYAFLSKEGSVLELGYLQHGAAHLIHEDAAYLLEFPPKSNNYFKIREKSVIFGLPDI